MAEPAIEVRLGAWIDLREEAAPIRYAVFVDEQKVPAEIELDDRDALSLHALALDAQGRVLGTGRLLPDGHIGRMAVLQSARGQGVGTALLRALLQAARARGDREVVLSAQTHAMPFYEKAGFIAEGDEYDDAGIPHRQMRRRM
ncbi:MAG: GNAT family N-acetyltransferase [Burkholderiales bacterium]|nr:GNAT family N-acetyltransferase [Burkholderiales bacterium]